MSILALVAGYGSDDSEDDEDNRPVVQMTTNKETIQTSEKVVKKQTLPSASDLLGASVKRKHEVDNFTPNAAAKSSRVMSKVFIPSQIKGKKNIVTEDAKHR